MTFISDIPILMKQWDWDRNVISPYGITHGSGKIVWWKCLVEECRYSWKTAVEKRARKKPTGCPACANSVVTNKNNFFVVRPNLAKGWHPTKNYKLSPKDVTPGSDKKVWWKCQKPECGYEWEALVHNRTRKLNPSGCPSCSNRVVTETNNLLTMFPELSKDWDKDKNRDLSPECIVFGSAKRVWWLCPVCGHSWKTSVVKRTSTGTGCIKCYESSSVSRISAEWLDVVGVLPKNREYFIKSLYIRVDGFDPETNTVYEFLGDYWHGNPERFNLNDINRHNNRTFGSLNRETKHRLRLLEKVGYKVVYIWERDFKKGVQK